MAQTQVLQQTNIDKYLGKLNEFNYNPNTNKTNITQAIKMQTDKIEEIKKIKINIDKSTFDENIKKQYTTYLDYIINIIEAKILKDNAIINLLNIAFNQINNVSDIINQSKDKFKKIESIDELIEIPNAPKNPSGLAVDYKFPVNNELKRILNIEESNIEENNITIETLKNKIEDMINKCAKDVGNNIEKFIKDLSNIGENESEISLEGGTNGTYIQGFESFNNSENKNIYISNLKSIKEAYENNLKQNIQAYKKICDLLSGEDGLLTNIIVSLRKIYKDSKKIESSKITKKWGLDLSVLLNKEPFKDNIEIFTKMLQQITAAKKELSNTPVRQNPQNLPGTQGIQEKYKVTLNNGNFVINGEVIKADDQPLRYSFANFLYNLNNETTPVLLTTYKTSLSQSLTNINEALVKSIILEGSNNNTGIARTNKENNDYYIAYVFGWNDPIRDPGNSTRITKKGYWRNNDITDDGKSPTETIESYITILERDITKNDLINITINMIKLLQHENLHIEKGSTTQGENNKIKKFKEELKNFKPNLEYLMKRIDGGYKKKSKSKKMTSKKTSMKVAKKTSSKAKENKNKNKKIVKSYSKSKSKKQSGGFIRGGVLFPQDFYDTSTVM